MGQTPTVGRIVHYQLSAADAELIDQLHAFDQTARNPVREGQVYPAQVTAVFSPSCVNLVVQLDGIAQYWATSRQPGDQPGAWFWPPRT